MTRTCPKCRVQNPETEPVCTACGWPLDHEVLQSQAEAQAQADAAEAEGREEKLLWRGRPSYKAALDHWLIYAAACLAAILLILYVDPERHPHLAPFVVILAWIVILPPGVWLLGKTLYLRWATAYRLTDQRLFIDRGLISRLTDQTELIRVDDVRVRQGPLDRMLNLGDVIVISTDASDAELTIRGIRNPAAVAEHVRTHMRRLRRRGLYVESL